MVWSPPSNVSCFSHIKRAAPPDRYGHPVADSSQCVSLGPLDDFAKSSSGPKDTHWELSATGCPYLSGGAARFMCEKHETFDGGDHTIIVGKVSEFYASDENALIFQQGFYKSS